MKRRILIVVLCIALVAIFLCGFYIGSQIRLQKRAEQVKVGMTYQEVCDLLGSKGESIGSGMPIYRWKIGLDQDLLIWLRDADTGSFDDWTVISYDIGDRERR